MYEEITEQARQAVLEIIEKAKLKEGDIFVTGCSSSTVSGKSVCFFPIFAGFTAGKVS